MSRTNLTFDDLLFIARRVGVEVMAAPSSHRGKLGKMGSVVGVTRHHTGTPNTFKPSDDFPDFNVVKEGRVGLVNSLSAFGLGRFRYIYVFSEFLSWHAGEWNWKGITDGNGHFLGIEAAGVGDWTPWQRNIYPRLVASILLFIGEGIDMMPRHLDGAVPKGRKTDMANEWGTFRAEVAHYLQFPEQINVNWKPPDNLAFPVKGAIRVSFDYVGGLNVFGQPKAPEVPTSDPNGRWQEFERGGIFWHPRYGGAAWSSHGEIWKKYNQLGRETLYGWPVTDELVTPDTKGRFNHFDHPSGTRSIYYTDATGAQGIFGRIRDKWADTGWEAGPLGYPVDEEHRDPADNGLIVQTFQNGTITWTGSEAIVALH